MLTLPTVQSTPTYPGQAELDATDLAAIAALGQQTGVVSGCTVTPTGTSYAVAVAAGTVMVAGSSSAVSAVASLAPTAASASDRRDIVVINGSGVASIVAGTPCGTVNWAPGPGAGVAPVKPAIPAGSVLAGEIYIPGGFAGNITSGMVVDKTATIVASVGGGGGGQNPYAQTVTPSSTAAQITTAINTAISAAQTRGDQYAEVIFEPGQYNLGSTAPTSGASGKCNAIIPLDPIPMTSAKVTLVLRGSVDADANYHWNQTVAQQAGACLITTYSNASPTSGNEPSVIGGPTPGNGYGQFNSGNTWSNMAVVIDGISISVPANPNVAGFDFRGMAQMNFKTGEVLANNNGGPGAPPTASSTWQWGLACPQVGHNARSTIGTFCAQGLVIGLIESEHVQADYVQITTCQIGLALNWNGSDATDGHGCHHSVLSIEACNTALANYPYSATTGGPKIYVSLFNFEEGGTEFLHDPNNLMTGDIRLSHWGSYSTNNILTWLNGNYHGGTGVRVIVDSPIGSATPQPAVPASTTALRNPNWRDCHAMITAGTSTCAVAIDGTTVVTIPASGVCGVPVPSGHTITLTYTNAPTWHWSAV